MKKIRLTSGLETLVDDDVYEWASRLNWFAAGGTSGRWYAARREDVGGKKKTVYLHRLLAGEDGRVVDHVNGNSLDNQRSNLRSVTRRGNQENRMRGYGRTGERNVYQTRHGRYEVKLGPKSGRIYIGVFDTLEEAAAAAKAARLRHFEGATR